jgi:hypothetical protein
MMPKLENYAAVITRSLDLICNNSLISEVRKITLLLINKMINMRPVNSINVT